MRKIILDFYDVLDEYIEEHPKTADEKDDTPKENPEVLLADLPENKVKSGRQLIHEYLKMKFDFPEYYGMNLDAFYECLTDITEPTCVGFFRPVTDFEDVPIRFFLYLDRVLSVLREAERDNPEYLAVISSDEAGCPLDEEEDPDEALSEFFDSLRFR